MNPGVDLEVISSQEVFPAVECGTFETVEGITAGVMGSRRNPGCMWSGIFVGRQHRFRSSVVIAKGGSGVVGSDWLLASILLVAKTKWSTILGIWFVFLGHLGVKSRRVRHRRQARGYGERYRLGRLDDPGVGVLLRTRRLRNEVVVFRLDSRSSRSGSFLKGEVAAGLWQRGPKSFQLGLGLGLGQLTSVPEVVLALIVVVSGQGV